MTLRWVPGWNGLTEPEAVSYVAAVEAADGEPLEFGVAKAINDFVLGCKNDGIWDAIKASCILAGARTLSGALVPLVGTAPTNNNFVAGDYNRETGLVGDGSTKQLDSGYSATGLSLNNHHLSVYATAVAQADGTGRGYIGENTAESVLIYRNNSDLIMRSASSSTTGTGLDATATGFIGFSRSSPSNYIARAGFTSATITSASSSIGTNNIFTHSRGGSVFSNTRLSFYSIGESLDLAAFDTRVSALITAIGAAIP